VFLVSIFCFATALVLSFALTWVVRDRAVTYGMVALPASARHIHSRPVPRVGGIAVYLAIATTIALLYLLDKLTLLSVGLNWHWLLAIIVPATVIFLLGLYDDLRGIGPYWKFGIQALAGGMVYLGGLRIVHLPVVLGKTDVGWAVSLLLTVFWILFITNAFNLIDGVDGLAAGSALFSTVALFIVATIGSNSHGLVVTAVLSGALLGFLRFNFNPATIFLGDSGSLLVGFILGAFALQGQKSPTMVAVAIPVVSCGLPMLETMLSVLRRFLSGKPIFSADSEHIHHKLLKRGLSQRQVAFILYGASAVFGLLSLILLLPGGGPLAVVLVILGGILWLSVQHLGYHEFFELRRVAQRTIEQKQIIINNLAVRRGIEQFTDCRNLEQFQSVLLSIFEENDFDGLELRYRLLRTREGSYSSDAHSHKFVWNKKGGATPAVWSVEMSLSGTEAEGALSLRRYSHRPLKLDVNLLGSELVEALQECLQRLLKQRRQEQEGVIPPEHRLVPGVSTVRAHTVGTA
jgi:UDP-GlcNAc:undecaprenyl-phosphate/decaprenyl-phosphate GlcNAc-1-phosphate transferase